jgi:hypothetical protein
MGGCLALTHPQCVYCLLSMLDGAITWIRSFEVNPKGQLAYGLVVSGAKAVYSYRQKATLKEV